MLKLEKTEIISLKFFGNGEVVTTIIKASYKLYQFFDSVISNAQGKIIFQQSSFNIFQMKRQKNQITSNSNNSICRIKLSLMSYKINGFDLYVIRFGKPS